MFRHIQSIDDADEFVRIMQDDILRSRIGNGYQVRNMAVQNKVLNLKLVKKSALL